MSKKRPRASFYGNKATKIFHRGDRNNDRCRASQIRKENRVEFGSPAEARRAGFRGCGHCFVRWQENDAETD